MSKNYILIFFLSFPIFASAQTKNQSLFWEITGPNQTKPSYMYGTMHVSDKIAYYLTDLFYEALLKVDYVALESDPKEWLEAFEDGRMYNELFMGSSDYSYEGFYRLFCPEPVNEEYLSYYLSQGNELLNGILYRNTLFEEDFQQDTYLDMFIYQTAKKYKKKFVGLEDYNVSNALVNTAMLYNDYEDDFDPWLTKLLKEKSYNELLEDAYRDQNIDLIDSLYNAFNNEFFNKYMITDRNVLMANSIDSLIQLGSVFAGIGAAHLPGEKGVIELLMAKGYTVKPIKDELTRHGKLQSAEIKEKITISPFTKQFSPDSAFSVQWLNKLYDFSDGVLISPDLTNGAYVLISRLNRFSDFFPEETCTLSTVDKLIFENVPGEVINKDYIEVSGHKAIDLLNKTKDGNYQRYYMVETPLEIILFKMDGPKNYVTEYGRSFFESISIRQATNEFKTVSTNFNGYKVSVPSIYKIENHSGFASFIANPFLQAINPIDSSFYFVSNVALTDFFYIEEDRFEAKMMQKRMYEKLELEDAVYSYNQQLTSKAPIYINDSIPTGDSLFLKSILAGNHYYLLGYYGSSGVASETFFNSFELLPFKFPKAFEEQVDTILHYSVTTYNEPPYHHLEHMFGKPEKKDLRKYEQITEYYVYGAPSKEEIMLTYLRYPLYRSYENLDSLWAKYKTNSYWQEWFYDEDFLDEEFSESDELIKILSTDTGKINNKFNYLDVYLGRNGSTKYIKNRFILNHGVLFKLTSMQDSLIATSPFVATFFETFTPVDTTIGYSTFEDKTALFLEDIYSTDTLRKEAALNSIYDIHFDEKYLPTLYSIIDTFPFTDKELEYKLDLIYKVCKMNTDNTFNYATELFQKSEYNSLIQISIIKALADLLDEKNSKKILELLAYDIPLPNEYILNNAFSAYFDSIEMASLLFPDLLNYATIEEYKSLVFGLLSNLHTDAGYSSSNYKKIKDFLITEARIELKRLIGEELKNSSSFYEYRNGIDNSNLLRYITLLAPFQNEKEVQTLFQKITSAKDIETLVHLVLMQHANGAETNTDVLKKVVSSGENIHKLARFLLDEEKEEWIKSIDINQDQIALSQLKGSSNQKIKAHETLFNNPLELNGDLYQMYVYRYKIEPRNYGNNSSDKWILGSICYKMPEKEKLQISAFPFYVDLYKGSENQILVPDDAEEIKKYYEKSVEYVEYENRKRVLVESYDDY
jgi:uncharacterized protein YbaP (TraB family)